MRFRLFKVSLCNDINSVVGSHRGGIEKSLKPPKCVGQEVIAIEKLIKGSKVIKTHSIDLAVSQSSNKNQKKVRLMR